MIELAANTQLVLNTLQMLLLTNRANVSEEKDKNYVLGRTFTEISLEYEGEAKLSQRS